MLKNGLLSHPGAATDKSMNAGKRIFPFQDSEAGVWHTFSRIIDRAYLLNTEAKDFLLKTIRANEDLLGSGGAASGLGRW